MTAEKCEEIRIENMERFGFGPESMKKIKVCSHCGEPSEAFETVCRYCNNELPKETLFHLYRAKHAFCSSCDTVVPKWMRFCPNCGKSLQKGSKLVFVDK